MCGITGFVDFRPGGEPQLLALARRMADQLRHRGPDAGSAWADPAAGFATGHRRLAIVELSEAGAQPMVSRCGRFVISYNGEIYNAAELRAELEPKGYVFRGHSDTEAILEGCAEWGVRATVRRLIGMFAFALWDRRDRRLWLVRDRLGIKPLYWGRFGNLVLFGSELKALRAHPDCPAEIDRDAMAAFLRFAYVPAPLSIYRGIHKLPPGTVLEVDGAGSPRIEPFWSLDDVVRNARADPFTGTDEQAEEELARLLSDAVQRRMIADVPLGAFLSGGIDSSAIVALMQAASARPVRTFSIGFKETAYDEAPHAKAVAEHLGTDHTELYVTPQETRDVIPSLPTIYDEPFADSSQIPTYLLSALTRRHVTVALSGDGGDELFCGYNRYFHAASLKGWLDTVPGPVRAAASTLICAVPRQAWDRASLLVPAKWRLPHTGDKLHKLAGVLRATDAEAYLRLVSQWSQPETLVRGGREPTSIITSPEAAALVPDYVARMQYLDTAAYLPDDILTKVDRASMAVSLEVRVPMIDHRVVQFAWRLPPRMRMRDGRSKWILRRVLRRFVPDHLVERPKMGFGVPIDQWLRGPLRDWAEDLLSEASLTAGGYLEAAPIRQRWTDHLSGHGHWHYPLWTVLMLQAWLREHHTIPHSGSVAAIAVA